MASPVKNLHQNTIDDLGVLVNFFVFFNYHIPSLHICSIDISPHQYLVNQILSHASADDNAGCEISHFSRFRKRFYDQVFELLDGCSGGVVVDSFQLHNTVKHCGLSSRRSRVQIPAGALHNSSMILIDTLFLNIPLFNIFVLLPKGFFSHYFKPGFQLMSRSRCMQQCALDQSLYINSCSNSFHVFFKNILMKLGCMIPQVQFLPKPL